jgi:DNA-binding CsgD family transcriptional regulator
LQGDASSNYSGNAFQGFDLVLGEGSMSIGSARDPARDLESLPLLPLTADHWEAICEAMQLSPQQARVVELVLRSAPQKQIAAVMGISEPTLKTYLDRIASRTGTRGRMQLAMHVLGVSHEVRAAGGVVQKNDGENRRPKR